MTNSVRDIIIHVWKILAFYFNASFHQQFKRKLPHFILSLFFHRHSPKVIHFLHTKEYFVLWMCFESNRRHFSFDWIFNRCRSNLTCLSIWFRISKSIFQGLFEWDGHTHSHYLFAQSLANGWWVMKGKKQKQPTNTSARHACVRLCVCDAFESQTKSLLCEFRNEANEANLSTSKMLAND